jgi:hypothetical protein
MEKKFTDKFVSIIMHYFSNRYNNIRGPRKNDRGGRGRGGHDNRKRSGYEQNSGYQVIFGTIFHLVKFYANYFIISIQFLCTLEI